MDEFTAVDYSHQVKDVCCGMAYLHSHQILHRSLIPRNILVRLPCNPELGPRPSWSRLQARTACDRDQDGLRPRPGWSATEAKSFTAPSLLPSSQIGEHFNAKISDFVSWLPLFKGDNTLPSQL